MTTHLRPAAAVAAGIALLTLGACRSSRAVDRPVARAPAPPPPAVAYVPPPPTYVAPPASPSATALASEQVRIQQETIARQREALEAERATREAAEARLRAAEEALAVASAPPSGEEAAIALETELRTTIVVGATVLREGNRVMVVLSDAFQSGSDRLKTGTDVQAALLATAAAISRHPEAQVSVLGHSDGQPLVKTATKWGDNVGLSRARAETVAKALEASGGIARDRLAVDGRGASEPLVAPETTAADRARNRRVEIQFSYGST
jgi:flagellar motor protein MotB